MSQLPLNKFEKEKMVIELSKQGKTLKEIAPIVHMSFRDISRIIKAYNKKKKLESKKEENNHSNQKTRKKLSISSQAFKLFKEGKKLDEVKVLLDIPFKKAKTFWKEYLESIKMQDCYEFYQVFQYDLPTLLPIGNFMKRNNIYGNNIVNVLRMANDVPKLHQISHDLKIEIKDLEQRRNYLLYYPSSPYSLQPLPLNKPKDNYSSY